MDLTHLLLADLRVVDLEEMQEAYREHWADLALAVAVSLANQVLQQ
jgi:hypothetical protein